MKQNTINALSFVIITIVIIKKTESIGLKIIKQVFVSLKMKIKRISFVTEA